MSRFTVEQTQIAGLQLIQRKPMGDERGHLERLFCTRDLEPLIGDRGIVQINHTLTAKAGTVRGMHFQHPPYAEMKLVSCLRGKVFDVTVDLRKNSPTFLHWHAEILSEEEKAIQKLNKLCFELNYFGQMCDHYNHLIKDAIKNIKRSKSNKNRK